MLLSAVSSCLYVMAMEHCSVTMFGAVPQALVAVCMSVKPKLTGHQNAVRYLSDQDSQHSLNHAYVQ